VRPEGLSAKNPNDSIPNRTRDLPACSAVPSAPPRAPINKLREQNAELINVPVGGKCRYHSTLDGYCSSKLKLFLARFQVSAAL